MSTDDLASELAAAIDAAADQRRVAAAARDAHRRHDERWRGYTTDRQRSDDARVAELTAALADLEAAARSLVDSRRWAVARQVGELRDRLGRGREPGTEERRLRQALADAAAAQRPAAPTTPPQPPRPPAGAEPAGTRALFGDLDGYLRTAMTDPMLPAPYDEPARRVIGVMDSLRSAALRSVRDPAPVSVVLAAHGPEAALEAALASAMAQHLTPLEVVLAGPLATTLAARWEDAAHPVRVVPGPGDRWGDHAAALAAATHPWIAHLEAGTVWEPDLLAVLGHAATTPATAPAAGEDHPRLVYAAQELIEATASGHQLLGLRFGPFHRGLLENRSTIGLSTVLHDRALSEDLGGPDPALGAVAGWELLLRYTAHAAVTPVACLLSRVDVTGRDVPGELTRTGDLLALADEPLHPSLAAVDERVRGPVLELPELAAVTGNDDPTALPDPLRRHGTARPTTVVIPSYEAPDELRLCLAALQVFSPDVRVVVVDNASGPATQAVIADAVAAGTVTLIANDRNLGFTYAVNQGIEVAGNDDVVLLNNDALVTPGWIDGLWAALDAVPEAGLVVPRHTLPPQTAARAHVPCADVRREMDVNLSALHANVLAPDPTLPDGLGTVSFAPFFAVYVPRRTLDEIGPLNVAHGPHYRSDRLYCDTVRHGARRPIVYTPHSKLYHLRRRATQTLKDRDPARYEAMYVFNDWERIRNLPPRSGS